MCKNSFKGPVEGLNPDEFVAFLTETEDGTHEEYHAKLTVKKKKAKKKQQDEEGDGGPKPGTTPPEEYEPEECEDCDDAKKAVVVIGCLTGNAFVDRSFRNTAAEAVSDFVDRGYHTTLLDHPTGTQLKAALADKAVTAFCYVGHGSDSDSDTAQPGGRGGSDFLWPNCDEIASASDVQRWVGGRAFDVVILHACFQGATNTAKRWQTAFGVGAGNYHSWEGVCRYFTAYWWQFGWS